MTKIPILMAYDYWINSQFSVAKYTGGVRINGDNYILAFSPTSKQKPDLLRETWLPIYKKLGREKTIKLIQNGTTLKVAKEMTRIKKEDLPKLF